MIGQGLLGLGNYSFDGTSIKFRMAILDGSGLAPMTGQVGGLTITAYDSLLAADAIAGYNVTEIGTTGTYEVSVPYSTLNRVSAGDGLWSFVPTHTDPTLVFEPKFLSMDISKEVGSCDTSIFTPTATSAEFSGLQDSTTDHYKWAFVRVLSGTKKGAVTRINTSSLQGSLVRLTFDAMEAALASTDKIMIVNI